jgi:hypothetical protein
MVNPAAQNVTEFCCSRVVFHRVKIHVPYINLLFDQDFIRDTFKRYIRPNNVEPYIIRELCGKCDGYGFYDWVSRLTNDGVQEPIWTRGLTKPIIVKNENPIYKLYFRENRADHKYIYLSEYDPSDLRYRCEQCLGSGLVLNDLPSFKPITVDDLPEVKIEKLEKQIKKPTKKLSPITKFLNHIKRKLQC